MTTRGAKAQLRQRLYLAAHQEVKNIISRLPDPVRNHAQAVPVIFEMTPSAKDAKSGIESDTLGLFTGMPISEQLNSLSVEPTQIILYMENIWDYVRHDATDYREEICRTYLHELGHYLGLEEHELEERNLD
ncbi:MAG TPA: metallopeptidase family protein [Kiritimatiellia bacterium]|nr:metallopeptidase family protein [Kiritimatiellia bacterium]